ncbi:MAG: hypothetical protein IM665_07895 [Phenylobacterium sp.]|nr:hypothetical protein [Phenylobacterium sp.]
MTKPDEALLWARERMATRCDEDGFPDVAESYRRGYRDESLREDFEAYRAGAAESADREEELEARVAELEAALAKANEPRWFYSDEEGSPCHSLDEAIEGFCEYLEPGWHFVEVETARPCKTIRGVVHILTDDEVKARGDDEPWVFTPCATEAEARSMLKEDDQ